jgi:hypothetical protein
MTYHQFKKNFIFFLFLFTFSSSISANPSQGKLLDKIAIIFNQEIITLSDLGSIKKNLPAISSIAPMIYPQAVTNYKQLSEIIIQTKIVRLKLKELGVTI